MQLELSVPVQMENTSITINEEFLNGFPMLRVGTGSFIDKIILDTAIEVMDRDKILYNFQIGKYS